MTQIITNSEFILIPDITLYAGMSKYHETRRETGKGETESKTQADFLSNFIQMF